MKDLSEIVHEAAERFDERTIKRASTETRQELQELQDRVDRLRKSYIRDDTICPKCKTRCGYSLVGWPVEDEEVICRRPVRRAQPGEPPEGVRKALVPCGTFNCTTPRWESCMFCPLCWVDYLDDPSAYQ
jgi:hypothetical protein